MTNPPPPWLPTLVELLGEPGGPGAELAVRETAGGDVVYRAPLARHHRLDTSDTGDVLWLRPITGGYQPTDRQPGDPDYLFGLNTTRRRSLSVTAADHTVGPPPRIDFDLATGQHATITTAGEDLQAELDRWDTFLTAVPAGVEVALDALTDDSWHGPYA